MKNKFNVICKTCKEPLDITDTTFDIEKKDVNQNIFLLIGELKHKSNSKQIVCEFCKDK